jgi:PAS domain S-box-containing protein
MEMAQHPIELILFRQLASSLSIPVFLVDERGDLAYLNEAAERLLGVRADDLGEMPFATWTTAFAPRRADGTPQAAETLPLVVALRERQPAHGPLVITDQHGTARTLEITAFPLEGGHGRLIGAVAMFWETTVP